MWAVNNEVSSTDFIEAADTVSVANMQCGQTKEHFE